MCVLCIFVHAEFFSKKKKKEFKTTIITSFTLLLLYNNDLLGLQSQCIEMLKIELQKMTPSIMIFG